MRKMRVCIYGGTHLDGHPQNFISELAYKILDAMPAVIVTGGFRSAKENPKAVSTDSAALEGAIRFANDKGVELKDSFEAWIPEIDDRRKDEGVVRMNEKDGITLRVMTGRTSLGRRLAMVAGVDIVITISGKQHTEVVVEQALELGIPVLPIPDAGGDSEKLLSGYKDRIADAFDRATFDECLLRVSESIKNEPKVAAAAVVALIKTAKVGRCLVLLPYDDEHNALYASTIEPSIAKHMIPLRLDRLPRSEAIYSSFAEAIRSSSAVIADITLLNENVMYEVGYSHGCGLSPLIYTRDPSRIDKLPVYFKALNVRLATAATSVSTLIDEYVTSFKTGAKKTGD